MPSLPQVKKGQVIKFLLEVPSVENQPSVRFLASWMLIRIIGDVESKYFQSLVRLVEEVGRNGEVSMQCFKLLFFLICCNIIQFNDNVYYKCNYNNL